MVATDEHGSRTAGADQPYAPQAIGLTPKAALPNDQSVMLLSVFIRDHHPCSSVSYFSFPDPATPEAGWGAGMAASDGAGALKASRNQSRKASIPRSPP